jgi:hypothetical protein
MNFFSAEKIMAAFFIALFSDNLPGCKISAFFASLEGAAAAPS